MDYLSEDLGLLDLTTFALGIEDIQGEILFKAKEEMILSGIDEVEEIFKKCGFEYKIYAKNSQKLNGMELIASAKSSAKKLHEVWKISQNILEYSSAIASYTYKLVEKAKKYNPNISVATTRKNFPGTKKLSINAVLHGGGIVHRLGLYDSILIFDQHLEFIKKDELKDKFIALKAKFDEKKVAVEVANFEDASFFASLGVDILQCEKMDTDELKKCVKLKDKFPYLRLSATGGITIDNVEKFAKTGVDFLVTSSPYHAKPKDVKVFMKKI